MEIRTLKYFLAIAQEESFSKAGDNVLFVTQPTLSRQMQELEEELGVKLFYRKGKRTLLTEEGLRFRKRAEEILELVDKTESELKSAAEEEIAGDIYIGAGETDGMRLIIRAICDVQIRYPKIRFHLFSGNAQDVMEKLDRGLLDFGLLIDPIDRAKYDFLNLPDRDIWGILMRKDHPLAQKSRVCAKDILHLPLITSAQLERTNWFSGWLGKSLDSLNIIASYNLIFNAALMVDEGLGCALTLDKLTYTGENSHLCFKPLSPKCESGLVFVWKKNPVFSRQAKVFLEALQEILSEEFQR